MMRTIPLAALMMLAACSAAKAPTAGNDVQNAQAQGSPLPLVVHTQKGRQRFDVEVALTPQQQEKGLMFRRELPATGGMLFPMDPPRTASFWMKDTLIPLDMLFIRTDGTIAYIKAEAAPYSREPVSAGIPVAAVLELAGGRAAALGIAPGDRVNWGNCAIDAPRPDEAWDRLSFCPKS